MARPRQNKEIKEHCSIRLEKHVKDELLKRYEKLQHWIDEKVREENILAPKETEDSPKKS